MILLSALAKTYAFILGSTHPVAAVLVWAAGMIADGLWIRARSPGDADGRACLVREVLWFNLAVLVVGCAVEDVFDYAAMRWKDGLPVVANVTAFLLRALGLPAAAFQGDLYLTTMAGPLRFAVSLDNLGLLTPALVAAFGGVTLLLLRAPFGVVWRRMAVLIGLLAAIALVRMVLSISLFLALCDFVSYETEELPLGPFVKTGTVAWMYLPFLLAAWPLLTRQFRLGSPAEEASPAWSRLLPWLAWPVLTVLLVLGWWEPKGRLKNGTVLINTFHTQWSRTDRPYDRFWYGADSGYNYACLKRWFEVFYDVRELKDRLQAGDLAHASVLILYLPDRPLTEEERRLILEFVRGGGGLFLIGDHTNVFGSTSHLNEVCRPFGFFFRDDVLFDLDEDFFQLLDVPRRQSLFLHGMTFFKFRGPASIQPTALSTRTVMALDHAKAMRAIYSVNNFYPPPHDDPRMKTGRFCVSAAARFGQGRVVAFADSTVFSNFEIFYPGKYEYLLNVAHWLNHADSWLGTFSRRCSLLAGLLGWAYLLVRIRASRPWLQAFVAALLAVYAARATTRWVESGRAGFPPPARPASALFFAADADDPAYVLRAFTSDEPYDQRYDVFVQWVLRTGAFSAFYVTGPEHRPGLYEHLRAAANVDAGLALIVRGQDQLPLLSQLAREPGAQRGPLLLMFSQKLDWETVAGALRTAGLVANPAALDRAKAAWPVGEVLIEEGGRRLLLVFSAERFSDQAMGYSEKVVPNEEQQALFDQAFSLFDRLFGKDGAPGSSNGAARQE